MNAESISIQHFCNQAHIILYYGLFVPCISVIGKPNEYEGFVLAHIYWHFSYNRSLCLQSQEDELVSCYYQCVIPAVVIRCLCGNLNNNIDYAYYKENLQ